MKLRIGCAQLETVRGDVKTNLSRMDKLIGEARAQDCSLVVFPELVTTGYGKPEEVSTMAETIPGPVTEVVAALAREWKIALAFGLPERDEETGYHYNAMLFLDAEGSELARYRKVHLWDTERTWAQAGGGFPVVKWNGVHAGMWICYDSRFPETGRSIAGQGGNLGLVSTAWLGPADEWELAIRSRAMDNGMYVAASAMLGKPFHGESMIVDPHGRVLARANKGENSLISAEIDTREVDTFFARVPLLNDLRPEAYT